MLSSTKDVAESPFGLGLDRTFSQGYAAEALYSAATECKRNTSFLSVLQDHEAQIPTLPAVPGPTHVLGKALCRKSVGGVMGLVTVSSNPDESDSIPAVHDVLVDPEIARELGFWGDVGSCSPSAIPSRSSSGAESVGPKIADNSIEPESGLEGFPKLSSLASDNPYPPEQVTIPARSGPATILLPWDM